MSLSLTVNGNAVEHQGGPGLLEVLAALGLTAEGAAIAVNAQVVPRTEHAATRLQSGDAVEVVVPMQGG